ncbi:MAG: hypothetical protein EAZ07_09685 [Cytophagales bacterium]|nr:MAG: hypothetical protein EAZ07_09685 [Cytophagales bacterium]
MTSEFYNSLLGYFGHYHPLVVHLPIGTVFFLFLVELIIIITKNHALKVIRIYLSFTSMAFTILSLMLGYFLSNEGGYDLELLENHERAGLILLFLTSLVFATNLLWNKKIFFEPLHTGSVILSTAMLFIAGHYGGSLTHGTDYLSFNQTKKTENKLEKNKIIKDINKAIIFTDIIQPIFNQKCVSCHNSEKKKGNLLMTSYEELIKGGKSGKTIIPKNAAQSELIKLIYLDPNNKRAMPPKGKVALTDEEKTLITWWVDNGASKDKKIAELTANENIKIILDKYASNTNAEKTENQSKLPETTAADETVLESIINSGINIVKIAQNTNMLDARYVINKQLWDDKKTENLLKIKNQLYILDLSGTVISNQSLVSISQLKSLNTLFIQNTSLNDDNIDKIKELQNLEYLNIYNTNISDKAITSLAQLKKLKKIYVWQSKISNKGIEQLQSKLPELKIVGANISI